MLLSSVVKQYENILHENLVGIYAHGSIGFGCFNWERSDIDFIVVIKTPISGQAKLQLIDVLIKSQAPPKGFEMSIVLEEYCNNFIYPTPYELHFSNDCPVEYSDEPKTDYDLAAHFTVIKNVGIVLCGKPISEVFGDIASEYYLDSICRDIENAVEHILDYPVYITLNLCRVYAYIKDSVVISKEQGGQWGLENLLQRYHKLIAAMLDNYVAGTALDADEPLEIEFAKYMFGLIFPNKEV